MDHGQELAGVKEGDILADKYRVERVLGVGGMGVVVAAHHLLLDDRVAIKFLLAHTLTSPEAVARFAREARAAVKIKSEHVARVSDVGTLETGAPYMVMEYLEGEDLAARVSERGALPVEQAVDFLLQACEAIAEAHALGIVHRDLKPANLFLSRRPGGGESVKVLDFGISKLTGASAVGQSSATKTSAMMGSPLYMSPEQMQSSKTVDARSDLWALGVILYELLSGKSPFAADALPEVVLKIVHEKPAPLQELRPDLPQGLEAVILCCLEKDRTQRYSNVGDLAQALLPFGSTSAKSSLDRISSVMHEAGIAMSVRDPAPASEHAAAPARTAGSTSTAFGGTLIEPAKKRSRAPLALGLGGAALLLVALGVFAFGGKEFSADAEPAATQAPVEAAAVEAAAVEAAPEIAPPEITPPTVELAPEEPAASAAPEVPEPPKPAAPARPPPRPKAVAPKKRAAAAPTPAPAKTPPAPAASPKKPSARSLIDDRR